MSTAPLLAAEPLLVPLPDKPADVVLGELADVDRETVEEGADSVLETAELDEVGVLDELLESDVQAVSSVASPAATTSRAYWFRISPTFHHQ